MTAVVPLAEPQLEPTLEAERDRYMCGNCVLLGLEPDGDHLRSDPALPPAIGTLDLSGIPGRWGHADVSRSVLVA